MNCVLQSLVNLRISQKNPITKYGIQTRGSDPQ